MGTGRPQKGMNRKNHHDHLSQSGQKSYGHTPSRQPKYTMGDAIMGKKPPKPQSYKPKFGGNTSGGKKPYKSM